MTRPILSSLARAVHGVGAVPRWFASSPLMAGALFLCAAVAHSVALAGPYAPAAGQPGSTAVAHDSSAIVGWATGSEDLVRGFVDISDPTQGLVDYGSEAAVLGPADAQIDSLPVLSLGDGGRITVTFAKPIGNGSGADFAVFENGNIGGFLELAHVKVSSNGTNFFAFASVSLTPVTTQVEAFGTLDPTNIHNLAGKYLKGFGMPFDLAELAGIPGLDINAVTHVRIEDVVGSIDPLYGTRDSLGNLINDPWPTDFLTGGFDLDAVGVLHFAVPEPSTTLLLGLGTLAAAVRRRR